MMARTGRVQVDYRGLPVGGFPLACYALARQLFVVDQDLAPLLWYAAGLSGRNPETLKELPATHRVVEKRAVAVMTLTKRRRGKANSRSTMHWSVDPDPAPAAEGDGEFLPDAAPDDGPQPGVLGHLLGVVDLGRQRPQRRPACRHRRTHRPVRRRAGPQAQARRVGAAPRLGRRRRGTAGDDADPHEEDGRGPHGQARGRASAVRTADQHRADLLRALPAGGSVHHRVGRRGAHRGDH